MLDADAGSPNATGPIRVLSEESPSGVGDAGIKTRLTIKPGPTDAVAEDDFGYSTTTEYFDDGIDNDPVTGLDVNL